MFNILYYLMDYCLFVHIFFSIGHKNNHVSIRIHNLVSSRLRSVSADPEPDSKEIYTDPQHCDQVSGKGAPVVGAVPGRPE